MKSFFCLLLAISAVLSLNTPTPELISAEKIWDEGDHSAFTDLVFFNGVWYCTFRESNEHVGGSDGVIQIIYSADGTTWEKGPTFAEAGVDLRDPKLSITPDGRLMLLLGGTIYTKEGTYVTRQPRVAFSEDGHTFSPIEKIMEPEDWLWRVTWHEGKAYGVSYRGLENEWIATLYESEDGIHYSAIKQLDVPDFPSEATIRFQENGDMIVLIRRGKTAWIGKSAPPFQEWTWQDTNQYRFGGPNFVILNDGSMWATGRGLYINEKLEVSQTTMLGKMSETGIEKVFDLPSGGDDTSYPGMVYQDGILWISYYSSHEGKTSIWLAKVKINLSVEHDMVRALNP